jgi:hypothetical protein
MLEVFIILPAIPKPFKRKLSALLAGGLLIVPFAAYAVYCAAYDEDLTLYKEYRILTDIGYWGFEIKIASGILYAAAWVAAGFLFRDSLAEKRADS